MHQIESFYFGGEGNLFGIYQDASGLSRRNTGILICPPLFTEYYRCHFVMRKLALELSDDGYDVLRFDYAGCGDSKGESPDDFINEFGRNIAVALTELKSLSGSSQISAIGIRFAAALLQPYFAELDKIALWDPVWTGDAYFKELSMINERLTGKHINVTPDELAYHKSTDFLGTGISEESVRTNLAALGITPTQDYNVEIVASADYQGVELRYPIHACKSVANWQEPALSTHFSHDVISQLRHVVSG